MAIQANGKTCFVGYATRDGQLMGEEGKVYRYGIAVKNSSKDENKNTTFYNGACFGKQLEWLNIRKGDRLIVVDPDIQLSEYNDKAGLQKRSLDLVGGFVENLNEWAGRITTNNKAYVQEPAGKDPWDK